MLTTTKWAILAVGGALGLAGSLSTLAGCQRLGQVPGALVGGLIAGTLGALGAWLASERLAGRVIAALGPTVNGRGHGGHPERIGWGLLDDQLEGIRHALAAERTYREEMEQVHGLLHRFTACARERAGDIAGIRGGLGQLRAGFAEIAATVGSIREAAGALGAASARMASGAGDQKETVGRTTHTVEALSDRIDRISQSAEDAAGATERTRQQANRGLEQIQGMIDGMDRLRAQIETNARKARRLGERSVEIGTIVELISGISSRTDMLALNATIESVRAGEHGRGFAVVAEEIRKLAERAAAATREIGTLVEAIQADTHESIRALAEEQAEMEQQIGTVREAGSALERISQMADDSARLVEEISRSANDQVHATRDLVVGMRRISDASKRILAESEQVREEWATLDHRCRLLADLTEFESIPSGSAISGGNGSRSALAVKRRIESPCEATR